MTIEEIKAKLQKCRYINIQIEMHQEELARLYSIAEKVTPTLSHAPVHGGDGDKMAARVANVVSMKDLINSKLGELMEARTEAERLISLLSDPKQKMVLQCYYFSLLTWEECCVKLSYSWRGIHKIHSAALVRLAEKSA